MGSGRASAEIHIGLNVPHPHILFLFCHTGPSSVTTWAAATQDSVGRILVLVIVGLRPIFPLVGTVLSSQRPL